MDKKKSFPNLVFLITDLEYVRDMHLELPSGMMETLAWVIRY